jgi:hypothetical protein
MKNQKAAYPHEPTALQTVAALAWLSGCSAFLIGMVWLVMSQPHGESDYDKAHRKSIRCSYDSGIVGGACDIRNFY